MPNLDPIQTAFNAGEIAGPARARSDLPAYKYALAFCENWIPRPQGSLLRRAGTVHRALLGEDARLFPFRVRGLYDNSFVVAALRGRAAAKVFKTNGQPLSFFTDHIGSAGHFYSSVESWTAIGAGATWDNGSARIDGAGNGIYLDTAASAEGQTFKLQFRARADVQIGATPCLRVAVSNGGGADVVSTDFILSQGWGTYTLTFAYPGSRLKFSQLASPVTKIWIDDVVVTRDGSEVTELVLHSGGLFDYGVILGDDEVQYGADILSGTTVFVKNTLFPKIALCTPLDRLAWGADAFCWEFYDAPLVSTPGAWTGALGSFGSFIPSFPSSIDFGYQGRLWLGAGSTVWGSKSGAPFDFTLGANANDAISKNVSMRGGIQWVKGQKKLLAGSDEVEHAVYASDGVLVPADFAVEDQSYYGSAPVQPVAIGDELVYVTRDRLTIRATSFLDRQGWVSTALTFLAQHLITGKVRELHYARTPIPTIFAVMQNGDLRACTYDRDTQVVAWWRVNVGAPVSSACVAETADGSELWMVVNRPYGYALETLPMHEAGVVYTDAAYTGVVPGNGIVTGLERFNGLVVEVIVDGTYLGDAVVAGGQGNVGAEYAGATVVIGLAYRSTAKTLPLEGANPAGTSVGFKVHYTEITARLNDSMPPLLNGKRVGAGRPYSTPNDALEARVTADLAVANMTVATGGEITVEQNLPYRTEVCGIYARASASKV